MNPAPERQLPISRLAVLCEDVEEDGNDRPAILRFPVHTIRFPPGVSRNYRPPVLTLYLQLQGGRGTFFLRVLVRRVDGVREIAASAPEELFLDQADDVVPLELALELHRLVFPEPEVYELLVYANNVNLHEARDGVENPFPAIRVTLLPSDGSPGGAV